MDNISATEILDDIYKCYGSDSGVLFGIKEKDIVKAIIEFTINRIPDAEIKAIEFGKWVTHNDWVYLPSKDYWLNEEQEELLQPMTSEELYNIFNNENQKPTTS